MQRIVFIRRVVSILPVVEGHAVLNPHEPSAFGPAFADVALHLATKDFGDFRKRQIAFEPLVDLDLDLFPVSVFQGLSNG